MAKSKQERDLDAALAELYPLDKVLHEYAIRVDQRTLYIDRFLPQRMLAIEVDGRQHFEYCSYFHGDLDGFRKSQARDRRKVEWLNDNGYALVRFRYDEQITTALLRERIIKAYNDDDD